MSSGDGMKLDYTDAQHKGHRLILRRRYLPRVACVKPQKRALSQRIQWVEFSSLNTSYHTFYCFIHIRSHREFSTALSEPPRSRGLRTVPNFGSLLL